MEKDEFIQEMLNIGGEIDQCVSAQEHESCKKRANDLYDEYFKSLEQVIKPKGFKVYDVETDSLHDLVSIDMERKRVVMHNPAYGHTSNEFEKVRLIQV